MIKTIPETIDDLSKLGKKKSTSPIDVIFIGGFLAGILLSFGCVLSLLTGGDNAGLNKDFPGLVRLLSGAIFPVGLILIVLTGADLFTGNSLIIPTSNFRKHFDWNNIIVEKKDQYFAIVEALVF